MAITEIYRVINNSANLLQIRFISGKDDYEQIDLSCNGFDYWMLNN
jgi:hypothetical protein